MYSQSSSFARYDQVLAARSQLHSEQSFHQLLYDNDQSSLQFEMSSDLSLPEIRPLQYPSTQAVLSSSVVPHPNPTSFKSACDLVESYMLKETLEIRELSAFEKIEINYKRPALQALMRIKEAGSEACRRIISNSIFEVFIIIVILSNTLTLALEDSGSKEMKDYERTYTWIYTVEALLKMGGMGLYSQKNSYFKDPWNILDFCIVVSGWVEILLSDGVNLAAVRMLRILRPLRSISSIEGMRVLFLVLVGSIKSLLSSLAVLVFYFLVFAIAGLQLYMGVLRYRCLQLSTGELREEEICGECGLGLKCAHSLDNPNYGVTNFDNIFYSFLAVFQCVTLEGWSNIMIMTQKTSSYFSVFYFIPLVFIGAFLFLNLTLAVIKYNFTMVMDQYRKEQDEIAVTETEEEEESTDQVKPVEAIEDFFSFPQRKLTRNMSVSPRKIPQIEETRPRTTPQKYIDQNPLELEETGLQGTSIKMHKIASISKNTPRRIDMTMLSELSDSEESALPEQSKEEIPREQEESSLNYYKLRSSVTASKRLIKRMLTYNDALNDATVKLVLRENPITSDSSKDVIPVEESLNILPYLPYDFMHADPIDKDENENTYSEVQEFRVACLRNSPSKSFISLKPSAYRHVKNISVIYIQAIDKKIGSIIGFFSANNVIDEEDFSHRIVIENLNSMLYRLWPTGFKGGYLKVVNPLKSLVLSKYFNTGMTVIVIANTIVLAIYHHGISEELENVLDNLNLAFTIVFIIELCLKLLGLGIIEYYRDFMNYIDTVVVIVSILELLLLTSSIAISAFKTLRIIRSFRVLRVARLFRYLHSLSMIVKVLASAISKFIYLALLLLLFITIYALIGMQIFGDNFEFQDGVPRSNFDNFHWAFVTVFQILTMEDWQTVLYNGMRSTNPACAFYFVSWIFLGNFVLLNLFLAILLDSFHEIAIGSSPKPGPRRRSRDIKSSKLHGNLRARERELMLFLSNDHLSEEDSMDRSLHPSMTKEYSIVECSKSFFIFNKDNFIRKFCFRISQSRAFETAIIVVICLSNLKLAIDTYLLEKPDDSQIMIVSSYLDVFFTIIFTIEMLIKSISLGFMSGENAYLKSNWNRLDFVIVMISLVELAFTEDFTIIRVFRSLRTLRPLRLISHNVSMKIVVIALFESIFAIVNVLVVLFIIWLMFAILGVSLFGGKFYQCENPLLLSKESCELYNYTWINADTNFDNIIEALISLFIVSSLEGWPQIMYLATDSTEVDSAPSRNYQPFAAYYFIIFVLIGVFLLLNLFIGVVFEKFEEVKKAQGSVFAGFMTKEQEYWVEIQHLLVKSKPLVDISQEPATKYRKALYKISKSPQLDLFIIVCILLNMLQMTAIYEGASSDYVSALEYINLVFTSIFILECLLKIGGLGLRGYFHTNSNKLDFFIVLCSILDLVLSILLEDSFRFLRTGPQLARIIRVLRVSRLVRVAKALKPIQELVNVLATSLPAVMNVLSLLLLVFFIYDILGVYSFSHVTSGTVVNEYTNFKDFGQTMVTLLRMSTGEDWHLIMYDCMREVNAIGTVFYFVSFVAVSSFIILNLFTMVVVQVHENYKTNPDISVKVFNKHLKEFSRAWRKYSVKHGGAKIHIKSLVKLMFKLGDEFGGSEYLEVAAIERRLAVLQIPIIHDFVYFHDVLFALLKDKYGRYKKGQKIGVQIIRSEEQITKRKLQRMRDKRLKDIQIAPRDILFNNSQFFISKVFIRKVFSAWKSYIQSKAGSSSISSSNMSSFLSNTKPVTRKKMLSLLN